MSERRFCGSFCWFRPFGVTLASCAQARRRSPTSPSLPPTPPLSPSPGGPRTATSTCTTCRCAASLNPPVRAQRAGGATRWDRPSRPSDCTAAPTRDAPVCPQAAGELLDLQKVPATADGCRFSGLRAGSLYRLQVVSWSRDMSSDSATLARTGQWRRPLVDRLLTDV